MKQAILNLKKKLLLVELPEGENIQLKRHEIRNVIHEEDCFGVFSGDKLLFRYPFKIEVIGKLTDITEEQFGELVAEPKKLFGGKRFNYKKGANVAGTAKESFFSYLEKEGILFYNPYAGYKNFKEQFKEAEEKVWNRSQTYLFEIL